ncbi:MAG TPA: OsmC family protein [Gemmatimonadaceae bacterium]|nr:OsmC family protein [Gemmatimonadaceae bacterium]
MKIILLAEDAIRLEPEPGPMTIEALSADQLYSPFHMLASGLAFCTFSILHSWAETVKLPADDLAVEVRWSFAEEPHRIGALTMTLDWPGLPPARRAAAERVAALCPIHGTLHHPPAVAIVHASGESLAPVAASAVGATV